MKSIYQIISVITILFIWGCQSNPSTNTANTPETTNPPETAKETTSSMTKSDSFNEEMYLFVNPEVAELIKQGKYKSGLDHYTQVGQNTKKPDGEYYESFFTGTAGNDTVEGFGQQQAHTHLSGVEFEIDSASKESFPLRFKNNGSGEVDVLMGIKEGGNEFILGSIITSINPKSESFYVGQGDKDYATIQNFIKSKDMILLAGKPDQYKWESKEGNMRISNTSGDLVAIVEGIDKLEIAEIYADMGVFTLK